MFSSVGIGIVQLEERRGIWFVEHFDCGEAGE